MDFLYNSILHYVMFPRLIFSVYFSQYHEQKEFIYFCKLDQLREQWKTGGPGVLWIIVWGHEESDMTKGLNNKLHWKKSEIILVFGHETFLFYHCVEGSGT